MEDNEIAAKRHKKRKTDCFYAPFASFRGYSLFPLCSLCCGLISIGYSLLTRLLKSGQVAAWAGDD